jgi:hypothetical protein
MPAIRRTAARSVARTTRSQGPEINVELRFREVSRQGGSAVSFDLEVHPGSAVSMEIVPSPVTSSNTVERTFYGAQSQYFRGLRVASERPEFVFTNAQGTHVAATIHLGTGRPVVMDGDVERIRVR